MYRRGFTISAALFLTAGIAVSLLSQAPSGRTRVDSHRSLGAPKSFKNLTLIPVYDSSAKSSNAYVTLDEGLRAGTVKVKESGQGGEVNTLHVTNTGSKPVYIMAGEVVLGGQQDRCLGRDTIIPPNKKLVPIAVFCVEHGRWTGHKEFQESACTVAAKEVRVAAQEGAFKAAAAPALAGQREQVALGYARADSSLQSANGVGSGRARINTLGRASRRQSGDSGTSMAALGDAQQKVWASVEKKNAKFKAESPTGTYRGVLNLAAGDAQKSVGPYFKALAGAADSDPTLVGMVAAVDGRVVAADVFSDTTLFRKLWPKLLRSYAADAAENGGAKTSGKPVVPSDARSFLIEASDGRSKAQAKTDAATSWRVESGASLSYRLVPNAAGGKAAIHENVLRK